MQVTHEGTDGPAVRRARERLAADLTLGGGIAVLLLALAIGGTGPATDSQGMGPTPVVAYVLAVVAALAVVGWRFASLVTFAVVGAATVAYLGAGFAFGPILVTLVVAAFGLALQRPVPTVLRWSAGLIVALAAAVAIRVQFVESGEWVDFPRVAGWVVVPLAVGIAIQVRRRAAAEVRDARSRRAASEERLRMAQDLHDVVGHGLAAIAMQAGVALHVLERDRTKVRESLEAIQSTSRDALDGLRDELAALTGEGHADSSAPRRPAPTLADLDVLVDRVRAGGVRVETNVARLDGLPAPVDGAAFRIVQESLTNVLRHAEAEVAWVEIVMANEALTITVEDAGSSDGALRNTITDFEKKTTEDESTRGRGGEGVTGQGIPGMRARAAAVGGTLMTGTRPNGGFRVHAVLPVRGDGSS